MIYTRFTVPDNFCQFAQGATLSFDDRFANQNSGLVRLSSRHVLRNPTTKVCRVESRCEGKLLPATLKCLVCTFDPGSRSLTILEFIDAISIIPKLTVLILALDSISRFVNFPVRVTETTIVYREQYYKSACFIKNATISSPLM